jgi:hypothetical protein
MSPGSQRLAGRYGLALHFTKARKEAMKRLLVAVGLASMMTFVVPFATLAQRTGTETQPGGMTPPAGVTAPGATGSQTTSPSTTAKQKKPTKQQLKMKDCAREAKAKGFRGDARKQFMSKCLSAE